jgi:cell volume regulation protein A
MGEPTGTAVLLSVLGALMFVSVLFSRLAGRAGLPVTLLFTAVGMLAGVEGIGRIDFEDFELSFRLGTLALVLILFDGGLNTPRASIREGIAPATVLATLGVVLTGSFVAVAARLLGLPWGAALLLGAIVSSTDAAAVFSILRGSGLHLKRRVGVTLELESGLNDPMAVILTMGMTSVLVSGELVWWRVVLEAVIQMAVGVALGLGLGFLAREVLRRARLPAAGLYPVLTLAVALVAFGVPTLFYGSGFLAVYLAGIVIGNGPIRYRTGVLRVHDAVAWFSQVSMFLMLGLLATPSRLVEVAWIGLGLGLVAAAIARPLSVLLCLLPFRYPLRERAYIAWVGLRGAVPIILATFPVLAGAPGSAAVFDIVFFIVVVNAFVPAATLPWLTKRLGVMTDAPPPPAALLELTSTQLLKGEMAGFYIDKASVACGAQIADLPFPESATAALVIRGDELLAPRGNTMLLPGDHVYVFCRPEDLGFVGLLLGQKESD